MATTLTCDGCGAAAAVEHRGRLIARDYCAPCAELADLYLAGVDAAHSAAVRYFEEKREACATESGLKELPL